MVTSICHFMTEAIYIHAWCAHQWKEEPGPFISLLDRKSLIQPSSSPANWHGSHLSNPTMRLEDSTEGDLTKASGLNWELRLAGHPSHLSDCNWNLQFSRDNTPKDTYIYMYIYIYVYMYICIYIYMYIYICVCVCMYIYIYMYVYIYICMYVYMCIYICVSVCVCVHVHI